jgi:hypothetical protein
VSALEHESEEPSSTGVMSQWERSYGVTVQGGVLNSYFLSFYVLPCSCCQVLASKAPQTGGNPQTRLLLLLSILTTKVRAKLLGRTAWLWGDKGLGLRPFGCWNKGIVLGYMLKYNPL